jgi:glyoxylase-like metal-dependent hydrolase (beta-lactamase superfamily II)
VQWKIGAVSITTVVEQQLHEFELLIPQATPESVRGIAWLTPHFADEKGQMTGVIQAFVVEAPGCTIVVDTCVGDHKQRQLLAEWHEAQTGFLERFRAVGFDPAAVDVVLCTHLHVDHVGWNTTWSGSGWRPTFPNARYLLADVELAHWEAARSQPLPELAGQDDPLAVALAAFAADQRQAHADSIQPILDAGLVDVVRTDHRVCDEVCLVPTPGHTPGHVSVWIQSRGREAVITGDCLHHPCQMARPEWVTAADADPAEGVASRRALLGRLSGTDALLMGSHFSPPTAGRVEAADAGFRLVTYEDPKARASSDSQEEA